MEDAGKGGSVTPDLISSSAPPPPSTTSNSTNRASLAHILTDDDDQVDQEENEDNVEETNSDHGDALQDNEDNEDDSEDDEDDEDDEDEDSGIDSEHSIANSTTKATIAIDHGASSSQVPIPVPVIVHPTATPPAPPPPPLNAASPGALATATGDSTVPATSKPASTVGGAKPRSTKPAKPRTPSPSPPPPALPLKTIRLEIKLGGPSNYEVDISRQAKDTGQRAPTPPPVLKKEVDSSDSEEDDKVKGKEGKEGKEDAKDGKKPKKRKVRMKNIMDGTVLTLRNRRKTSGQNIMTFRIPSLTILNLLSTSELSLRRQSNKDSTSQVVKWPL